MRGNRYTKIVMSDLSLWTARWRRWAFEDERPDRSRLEQAAVFLTRLLYGIVRRFADGQLNRGSLHDWPAV